jgi:hypothetical protein
VVPVITGTAYYSIVAPGILLDEGSVPLVDGRFDFRFLGDQLGAEFPNLKETSAVAAREPPLTPRKFLDMLVPRPAAERLSDTIEVVVFAQGHTADGAPATAGAKFVMRGGRLMVPRQFLAPAGGRS